MPNALLPLPDVNETVSRRVLVDAVRQLSLLMRLPESTQVYLPGQAETVPLNGGTFGDCCATGITYPTNTHLVVRASETVDELQTLTTHPKRPEHMTIWEDPIRDIQVRPVYRYTTVTLEMEFVAQNPVMAKRWLDEARSRISRGGAELYFDLQYHYNIPHSLTALWNEVYQKMQASEAPTDFDNVEAYIDEYLRVPDTNVATLIGTHELMTIPEHQYEVLGWFDYTTTPNDPEKLTPENGAYRVTINYTFHYTQPVQLFVKWPLVIHQQLIGAQFRLQKPYTTFRNHTRRVSTTKGSFDAFTSSLEASGVPYLQLPGIDDWIADYVPAKRLTFISALCVISQADKTNLLDLANLGDFKFTTPFLEYFTHQNQRLFGEQSVYEFRLYANDRLVTTTDFYLEGTTLFTTRELDLTEQHHVQISLKRNWYLVDRDGLECLRRYPYVLWHSLRALGVVLQGKDYPNLKLLGQGYARPEDGGCPGAGDETGTVPRKDLDDAIDKTDDRAGDYIDRKVVGPWTVMYLDILSRKTQELADA